MASVMPVQFAAKRALGLTKDVACSQSASLFSSQSLAFMRCNQVAARVVSSSGNKGWESDTKRGSVARGAGMAAETSTAELSVEELKKKGDSYFAIDKRPIILFDGVCNLCNGSVNFVLDIDPEGKLRFAALQSDAGRALLVRSGLAPDFMESVVLVDQVRGYVKSEAVLQTCSYLGFPFPPIAFAVRMVPLFIRDIAYDQVALNRYALLGQSIACRFSDPRFEERFITA